MLYERGLSTGTTPAGGPSQAAIWQNWPTISHVQSKGRASLKGLSMAAAEAALDVKCAADGDLGSPAAAALLKGEASSCSRQNSVNNRTGGEACSWGSTYDRTRTGSKVLESGSCGASDTSEMPCVPQYWLQRQDRHHSAIYPVPEELHPGVPSLAWAAVLDQDMHAAY